MSFPLSSEAPHGDSPDRIPVDVVRHRQGLVPQAAANARYGLSRMITEPVAAPEQTAAVEARPPVATNMYTAPTEAPVAAAEPVVAADNGTLDIEAIRREVAYHATSSNQTHQGA